MPEYQHIPVVLYDGQHEIDVGNIEVDPLIEFKTLSSILSDKIGIDHDRVVISIVKSSPSPPRKMILHENKIFSHILQKDKDCYFLVSLKSPQRRGRRGGRNRSVNHQDCYFTSSSQIDSLSKRLLSNPPQILRRNSTATPCLAAGLGSSYYDQISTQNLRLGYRDYATQLQIEKENYLMSMINNSYPYGYGRGSGGGGGRAAVCDVCSNADGGPVPFHWCVYDATTVGFRSPAGPIARPSKG
ncbi:hypothetical protein ACHQM5_019890 [Ranunculus cassubicifolius]